MSRRVKGGRRERILDSYKAARSLGATEQDALEAALGELRGGLIEYVAAAEEGKLSFYTPREAEVAVELFDCLLGIEDPQYPWIEARVA